MAFLSQCAAGIYVDIDLGRGREAKEVPCRQAETWRAKQIL